MEKYKCSIVESKLGSWSVLYSVALFYIGCGLHLRRVTPSQDLNGLTIYFTQWKHIFEDLIYRDT